MPQSELIEKVTNSVNELVVFIQKWKKLQTSGSAILNSIVNIKRDSKKNVDSPYNRTYPQGLQEKCSELEVVINELETALNVLQLLVHQLYALSKLNEMQYTHCAPLFNSWPAAKFSEAFNDIYHSYSEELTLKRLVKEEVSHCSRTDTLLFHAAVWESQPFISNNCLLTYESIRLEIGVAC